MAVSYDNSVVKAGVGQTLSANLLISGSDRILLVGVMTNSPGGSGYDVLSVTYAGNALTYVDGITRGSSMAVELWKLVLPPTGTNTIIVTQKLPAVEFSFVGISFNGSDGTISGTNTAADTSGGASVTVTSAVNSMVADFIGWRNAMTIVCDVSQTERQNSFSGGHSRGCSTEAGAASVAMDWTAAGSEAWAIIATSVKDGTQTETKLGSLTLMGVGI